MQHPYHKLQRKEDVFMQLLYTPVYWRYAFSYLEAFTGKVKRNKIIQSICPEEISASHGHCRESGLDDLQSSLPAQTILQFCDSMSRLGTHLSSLMYNVS